MGKRGADATFQATFEHDPDAETLTLTRVLPEGERDTSPVDIAAVRELEKRCRDLAWHRSREVGVAVGSELFELLNGDGQWLVRACI